jgi:hypothetical protein
MLLLWHCLVLPLFLGDRSGRDLMVVVITLISGVNQGQTGFRGVHTS